MIEPEKMTKTERVNWKHGVDAMRMIEHDIHDVLFQLNGMPMEWHQVAQDEDKRDGKRTRCTVAFDADVVRFFKAMGPGYQARMNRVLRSWMHFRLAKIIEGPDANDYVLRPNAVAHEAPPTEAEETREALAEMTGVVIGLLEKREKQLDAMIEAERKKGGA